jgi:hypothetical protein
VSAAHKKSDRSAQAASDEHAKLFGIQFSKITIAEECSERERAHVASAAAPLMAHMIKKRHECADKKD